MDFRTPKTHIVRGLRLIWMRSRERAFAFKRDNYSCVKCGVKQSKAKGKEQKIVVHHKKGIGNWNAVIELMQKEILCNPENLECLCPRCHEYADLTNKNK